MRHSSAASILHGESNLSCIQLRNLFQRVLAIAKCQSLSNQHEIENKNTHSHLLISTRTWSPRGISFELVRSVARSKLLGMMGQIKAAGNVVYINAKLTPSDVFFSPFLSSFILCFFYPLAGLQWWYCFSKTAGSTLMNPYFHVLQQAWVWCILEDGDCRYYVADKTIITRHWAHWTLGGSSMSGDLTSLVSSIGDEDLDTGGVHFL